MNSAIRCKTRDEHGHRCKRQAHGNDPRHHFKGKGHEVGVPVRIEITERGRRLIERQFAEAQS